MKKAMLGTTLAVFALAPALAWSDCGVSHDQSAMAQMVSAEPAHNASSTKANALEATPATAKAADDNAAKRTAKAAKSKSKTDAKTVVAKHN